MELESYPRSNTLFSHLLEQPDFEYKLFRQLGLSSFGASTVAECLSASRGMELWDLVGWAQVWKQLAETVQEQAEQAHEQGHHQSASERFLRAANYFHQAEYYAIITDGDHVTLGIKCEECFEKALALLPWHGEKIELGDHSHDFTGYFISPDDSGRERPTVAIVPGFESSAEEQYFCHGITALQRGFNVLLFQGPGQAGALRRDPASHLRHDYEIPLQVALDFLHDRPEVDRERLAMLGTGLGGYFCLRVAAFDPRVKALMVNPPIVNMRPVVENMIGPRAMIVDVDSSALSEVPPSIMRGDIKLLVINMCRRFGVRRLQSLLHETEAYAVKDLLYRIHCPVLSVRSLMAYDEMNQQADMVFTQIRSEDKTQVYLPSIHQADAHNHFSNFPHLNQELFDWLGDRFMKG